jgi:hypothetical protein
VSPNTISVFVVIREVAICILAGFIGRQRIILPVGISSEEPLFFADDLIDSRVILVVISARTRIDREVVGNSGPWHDRIERVDDRERSFVQSVIANHVGLISITAHELLSCGRIIDWGRQECREVACHLSRVGLRPSYGDAATKPKALPGEEEECLFGNNGTAGGQSIFVLCKRNPG